MALVALIARPPWPAWRQADDRGHRPRHPAAAGLPDAPDERAKRSLRAPRVPYWHDHFVFDGTITLKLPKGEYDFVIERGPEYLVRTGHFTMDDFSEDTKIVDLKRFADMAAEGWCSGDLDVRRPAKDIELLMKAEDLHVVQLVTWPDGIEAAPGQRAPATIRWCGSTAIASTSSARAAILARADRCCFTTWPGR